MRRVVITGMGIWSSIGQDLQTVTESLKQGRSGIVFDPKRVEYGLRSGLVGAVPRPDLKNLLPRRTRQMMSEDAEYAYMAASQAFEQAGITDEYLLRNEVGIIFGNDGTSHPHEYAQIMEKERTSLLVGYNELFKTSPSSSTINLATIFHLRGMNLSVNTACASASNAIGMAYWMIQQGKQEMMLVGGSRELRHDNIANIINDALYTEIKYEKDPSYSSRPFDKNAIGCITTGGAAALVIEEYEHAISRGATVLAEIVGFGFASDGAEDIRYLHWESEYKAITMALLEAEISIEEISYIHSRADSFPMSDRTEALTLIHTCKGIKVPITSTDAITGHGGGMGGTANVIYSILMLNNNFIAPLINLEDIIPEAKDLNMVCKLATASLQTTLVTGAGIGGSYNAIIIKKFQN